MRLMTDPAYHEGWTVIPPITVAVTLQGWYLLTSIGLNITKRTQYYPLAAGAGAAANVAANVVLIPRFGILGPAWANVISYAVLAGVAYVFSQRFYPLRYEWGRIARVVAAGVSGWAVAVFLVPQFGHPLSGILASGTAVVLVFAAVLAATGFLRPQELEQLARLAGQLRAARRRRSQPQTAGATSDPDTAAAEDPNAAVFEEDR
jgi:O-antigen/teichoic acid export membrane protein